MGHLHALVKLKLQHLDTCPLHTVTPACSRHIGSGLGKLHKTHTYTHARTHAVSAVVSMGSSDHLLSSGNSAIRQTGATVNLAALQQAMELLLS